MMGQPRTSSRKVLESACLLDFQDSVTLVNFHRLHADQLTLSSLAASFNSFERRLDYLPPLRLLLVSQKIWAPY